MKKGYSKFDAAEYLLTEEDRAAYLAVVLEEDGDDPAFVAKALGTIARARGMSALAKETKISRRGLYDALSGKGNPEFATILKVISALGLQLSVTSKPKRRTRSARANA